MACPKGPPACERAPQANGWPACAKRTGPSTSSTTAARTRATRSRRATSEDGVLTCKWHNWKFELGTGACMFGGEGVRRFPSRGRRAQAPDRRGGDATRRRSGRAARGEPRGGAREGERDAGRRDALRSPAARASGASRAAFEVDPERTRSAASATASTTPRRAASTVDVGGARVAQRRSRRSSRRRRSSAEMLQFLPSARGGLERRRPHGTTRARWPGARERSASRSRGARAGARRGGRRAGDPRGPPPLRAPSALRLRPRRHLRGEGARDRAGLPGHRRSTRSRRSRPRSGGRRTRRRSHLGRRPAKASRARR